MGSGGNDTKKKDWKGASVADVEGGQETNYDRGGNFCGEGGKGMEGQFVCPEPWGELLEPK